MSHTRGKWHHGYVGGGSSFRFRVYAHEREIAMLWHHPGQPEQDAHSQELADARLIAASPSLYAAAKRLLDPVPGETLDEVMAALREAVEQVEERKTSCR